MRHTKHCREFSKNGGVGPGPKGQKDEMTRSCIQRWIFLSLTGWYPCAAPGPRETEPWTNSAVADRARSKADSVLARCSSPTVSSGCLLTACERGRARGTEQVPQTGFPDQMACPSFYRRPGLKPADGRTDAAWNPEVSNLHGQGFWRPDRAPRLDQVLGDTRQRRRACRMATGPSRAQYAAPDHAG